MGSFAYNLIISSAVIGLAVIVGGMIPAYRHYHRKDVTVLLSFSAGIMLGSSFIHLIPRSIEMIGVHSSYFVLAGFLFLFLVEKFVTVHICEAMECEVHRIGISAFMGLALHSAIDGFALGSGLISESLGFIVFVAVFAHKTPEAFSLTSVLLHSQFKTKSIIWLNFMLWLMVPMGASLAWLMVGANNTFYLAAALSFAAGTFLEICFTDLIPEIHKTSDSKSKSLIGFVAGLILMYLLDRAVHGTH